jgi:flagella basal body P-ring formation protein FlgA
MTQPDNKPKYGLLRHSLRVTACLGGSLFLLLATPTAADSQPSNDLRQSVLSFLQTQTANQLKQDIEINVGRIDRRLKLAACQKPPTPFLAAGAKLQGKLTVGLRCMGPKPWTVYIPAQIKIFANVVTATQPLLRGSKISAADVMPMRQEISQLRGGYFQKTTAVIGKILKQNLAAGHVISPARVKAPILVRRGEKVAIIVSIGSLKVRGKGEALRDAALGELVSVRNSRSRRIVQGIATKPGTVNVQM